MNDLRYQVQEDTVVLPDGKQITYVFQKPTSTHSVILLVFNLAGELLMQREYSYPPNEIMWQLPGGQIEKNESIHQAAQRELAEESGLKVKKLKKIGFFYVQNRKSNRKQYVLVGHYPYEVKAAHDDDEFIESHWISLTSVEHMIAKGEIHSIHMLAALYLWRSKESR